MLYTHALCDHFHLEIILLPWVYRLVSIKSCCNRKGNYHFRMNVIMVVGVRLYIFEGSLSCENKEYRFNIVIGLHLGSIVCLVVISLCISWKYI